MSGKCRPSLRKKTLENVMRSNLSNTDKECIAEVFKRYEIGIVEVVRCKECAEWDEQEQECSHYYGFRENDFCSFGEQALKEGEKE